MDIDVALRELGDIDNNALKEAVLALDEAAWQTNQFRQLAYDVHSKTESLVLVFTDGTDWPNIEVKKESGWDLLAEFAVPLMQEIIRRHYSPGGAIIRAMAAKLVPGGLIKPHRDSHPSFHHSHRIHVPLTTNPRVRFVIDGQAYQLQVGQVYEINNQKQHSVMNKGKEDRISFIFDYIPPSMR